MDLPRRYSSTTYTLMFPSVFFVLVALILTVVPHTVRAATGLGLQPVKVAVTVEPGASTTGVFYVTNDSGTDIEVVTTVEDFVPIEGTADIQFVPRAEGNTSVRDWITLDIEGTTTFKVGERREVPYRISVPLGAEPGGHFGVALFEATEPSEEGSLKVGTRVGSLLFVTVPGPSLKAGVVRAFHAPQFVKTRVVPFEVDFQNTGTVHYEPQGVVRITNMLGKEVGEAEVGSQTVLPSGMKTLRTSWDPGHLPLGKYTAALTIADGDGNALAVAPLVFYAFPVWHALVLLLSLVVLYGVIRFVRRHISVSLR